jgi:hypothetical protein
MKFFSNTVIVTIGGVLLIVLGLFHLTFWDLFDWGNELPKLSKGNSSLVQMMAICTVCYLTSMGLILLVCRRDITESRVGKLLLLSLSVFFIVRLILEFTFRDGNSVKFITIFLLCIAVYTIPLLKRK